MKKKTTAMVMASLMALTSITSAFACTGTIVGSDWTDDGSTIVARTEDISGNHAKNYIVHPRTTYKAGEMFKDVSTGFAYPQPSVAYQYTSVPDTDIQADGYYGEIGFNEYGVSVDATVSASANEKAQAADPYVEDGLREADIVDVILPRVKSARAGVNLVVDILNEKGAAEGNVFTISDKDEVWYIEIYTGHRFAAYKVPDNVVAVFPNCFMLGYVDLNNAESYVASKDLIEFAKQNGFYQEYNGKFHAALSYSEPISGGNRDRVWAGQNFLGHAVDYDAPVFDLFFTPDDGEKISVKDVMELQRYRNEGTEKTPEKDSTVRTIGTERSAEAHIVQFKDEYPKKLGGLLWMTMGNPEHSVYLPSFGNINDTADAYQVEAIDYNADSAYWKFRSLSAVAELNREMYGAGVRAYWDAYEDALIAQQEQTDDTVVALMAKSEGKAAAYTTELADTIANDAMSKADLMFSELMGYIAKNKTTDAFVPSVMAEFEAKEEMTETVPATEVAPAETTATTETAAESTTEEAPAAEAAAK